ncbi:hypothetical protein [Planctomycetes bacterium Pan216]|uniref:hypothetical protein n=1 Tax=Kolteria novifilia TaxID=2527975 RepID=UPI0011A9AE9C
MSRSNRPCGIEYTLLAPRSVRLSAIWEAESDRILFYDQNLERFQTNAITGPGTDGILERPKVKLEVKSLWKGK